MSVKAIMRPRGDQGPVAVEAPADSRPEPSLIDTISAGFRAAKDEVPFIAERRIAEAYDPVIRAVTEVTGKSRWSYVSGLQVLNPFDGDATDYDAVWRDIAAARVRDPKAFPDLPADRASFERAATSRGGARASDLDTLARGGAVAGMIGGVGAQAFDPVNTGITIATGGAGAARSILWGAMREAGINVGAEVLETPMRAKVKGELGEEFTARDAALNIASAGAFGAAFHAGARGVAAGAEKLTPTDWQTAQAFKRAVRAEWRTTDQQAAVNVIERAYDIDATNPFANTYDGIDAHAARIEAMIADFHEPPRAGVAQRPADAVTPRQPGRPSVGDSRAALKAAIRGPESGGDDRATNRMGSSASGRYQFIESTFKSYYRKVYGGDAGAAWRDRRFDPALQERLMDALIDDNAAALRKIGAAADAGNLYVYHVLGAGAGEKFLRADPDAPVSRFMSAEAIRQNPTYLGGGKSVGEALAVIRGKVGGEPGSASALAGIDLGEGGPVVRSPELDAVRPVVGDDPPVLRPEVVDEALVTGLRGLVADPLVSLNRLPELASALEASEEQVSRALAKLAGDGAIAITKSGQVRRLGGGGVSGPDDALSPEIVGDLPASGVAPANVGDDGRIYVGPQGSSHYDVMVAHPTMAGKWGGGTGFVTPEGKFLDRTAALTYVKDQGERIRPSENMGNELDALDYRDQSKIVRGAEALRKVQMPHAIEAYMDEDQMFSVIRGLPDNDTSEAAIAGIRSRLSGDDAAVERFETAREKWGEQFEANRETVSQAERDAAEASGELPPTPFDEATLRTFDDPVSDAAAKVADDAWHDIKARLTESVTPDPAKQMTFDLGDGQGPRKLSEIDAELEADKSAIDIIESCMAPPAPGGAA